MSLEAASHANAQGRTIWYDLRALFENPEALDVRAAPGPLPGFTKKDAALADSFPSHDSSRGALAAPPHKPVRTGASRVQSVNNCPSIKNRTPKPMSRPEGYRFLKTHEWARIDGDLAWIGISDFAVKNLSDLVFVDLPTPGQDIMQNEPFGDIESVKAVSDLYAPLTGEILERNEALMEDLDLLKEDPWEKGWMLKIRMEKPSEFDQLLDGAAYEQSIQEED